MKTTISIGLALAGGLAAPANAVVVTKTFNLNNDGSGATAITLGDNSFSQFVYSSIMASGKTTATFAPTPSAKADDPKPTINEDLAGWSKNGDGNGFVKPAPLPNPNDVNFTGVTQIGNSELFAGDLRYLSLKFPINGVSTVGNAYFDLKHGLVAVQYVSPSAVPEPDTWVELLAGFALAGAAVRRRRQLQSA